MKLVFKVDEVAAAIGKTPAEFKAMQSDLELLGFPKPVPGLDESWSIMHVINWVNNETPHPQSHAA